MESEEHILTSPPAEDRPGNAEVWQSLSGNIHMQTFLSIPGWVDLKMSYNYNISQNSLDKK